jgi:hypothetical protein
MLGLLNSVRTGAGGATSIPSFSRDFATVKTLNHGTGPDITFTRTGTATFFDSSGVLTTSTANTPRFDHDPVTLASKGLLVEEGRTNSLPNSQMSGVSAGTPGTNPSAWNLSGSTSGLIRTIATETTLGFKYIDVTFIGTVTSGPLTLNLDPQFAATGAPAASIGQTWTASVYLALINGSIPASGMSVNLTERNSSNVFLLSTTLLVQSATSSLQRFAVTRTLNQSTVAKVTLDLRFTNIPTNTVVNFTLRIAAPQLELGSFATSYIPTNNSGTVSRGADVGVVTPISSFVNQSGEESLFSEFSAYGLGSTFPIIVQLDQGAVGAVNKHNLNVQSSGPNVRCSYFANNTNQYDRGTSYTLNSIAKIASGVASNDGMVAVNGSFLTAGTSITLRTTQNTHLQLGNTQGSTNFLNGHLRKVAYYPRRLSNEKLRSLTV